MDRGVKWACVQVHMHCFGQLCPVDSTEVGHCAGLTIAKLLELVLTQKPPKVSTWRAEKVSAWSLGSLWAPNSSLGQRFKETDDEMLQVCH